MTNPALAALSNGCLVWIEEAGVGYLEARPDGVYDSAYFDRYAALAETPIGRALNEFRAGLVLSHALGVPLGDDLATVLDVGIGDGAFVRAANGPGWIVKGFDVNPAGVDWLNRFGLFGDLYRPEGWPVLTFWDSLEHIRDPGPALAQATAFAFVSIPIFADSAHARRSKHYRPDEHYWYFTRRGFVAFAEAAGFEVLDVLATETVLGREDIETFVLRRVRPAPVES